VAVRVFSDFSLDPLTNLTKLRGCSNLSVGVKTGRNWNARTPKSQLLNLYYSPSQAPKIISLSGIFLEKLGSLNGNLCNIIY
jgi:hypothetical protein